jgi:type VI secretion system protein
MTLTLSIKGMDRLDNGMPAEFVLNRRGAMIGRSPTCDWSLPDPRHYISSRHCEVTFRDGFYLLTDVSTNGTFLNGAPDRMAEPRRIESGDRFTVGQYEVVAALTGEAVVALERSAEEAQAAQQAGQWSGWGPQGDGGGGASPAPSGWGSDAPAGANSGWSGGAPAAAGDWGVPPPAASAGSSDWGAPARGGAAPPAGDWGAAPPAGGASDWGGGPAAPAQDGSDWGAPSATPAQGGGGWGAAPGPGPAPSGADAGWGAAGPAAPPAGDGGGWGVAPADASPSSGSWAPKVGPSLARDAAHVAHARDSRPSASGAASLGGWQPSQRAPEPPPVRSTWDQAIPEVQGASAWSSAVPDRPAAPSPDDVWGKIADGNVVDWARGGFGQPVEENRDPLGLNKPAPQAALPKAQPRMARFNEGQPGAADWGAGGAAPAGAPAKGGGNDAWGAPAATPQPGAGGWGAPEPDAQTQPPTAPIPDARPPRGRAAAPPPAAPPGPDPSQLVHIFAAAAGLKPGQLKQADPSAIERAGRLLRQLVSGLVVMVEARARAKSQLGAEATSLNFDGNNPIKFARTPEQAIAQLLNPKEKGFMDAEKAIEDAFYDLQSHQMATLKAMQGALRATLERFSPNAIKARAEDKGLMARIMPGAREAALWQAYEREFSGVAQGSDEAFMDMFAKEFRKAYMEAASNRGNKR